MKEKNILLVSDHVGVGRVALSAMIPILSTMESKLSYLPTAVVSNNFGYGEAAVYDLTKFMEQSKDMWKKHDFQFDIIYTGIILNTEQVKIVGDIIEWQKEKPTIIVDPIMGDGGKMYPGLSLDMVEAYKDMIPYADIMVPNFTELTLLLEREYPEKNDEKKVLSYLEELKNMGAKRAVVTSVNIDDKHYVYAYDKDHKVFKVEYRHIPIEMGGTGDVFSALLIGRLNLGDSLKESITYATKLLTSIIEQEYKRGVGSWAMEVEVERYLQEIYKSNNI